MRPRLINWIQLREKIASVSMLYSLTGPVSFEAYWTIYSAKTLPIIRRNAILATVTNILKYWSNHC
jgi:hypothetical protein